MIALLTDPQMIHPYKGLAGVFVLCAFVVALATLEGR